MLVNVRGSRAAFGCIAAQFGGLFHIKDVSKAVVGKDVAVGPLQLGSATVTLASGLDPCQSVEKQLPAGLPKPKVCGMRATQRHAV